MIYYVAGPMTGIPQFNYPAINAAAATLRAQGHEVISPAEMDEPSIRAHALASHDGCLDALRRDTGETFGSILARDVLLVADVVDAIAVLPGWRKSRGARLELFVAYLTGKPVYCYPTMKRLTFVGFLVKLLSDARREALYG